MPCKGKGKHVKKSHKPKSKPKGKKKMKKMQNAVTYKKGY